MMNTHTLTCWAVAALALAAGAASAHDSVVVHANAEHPAVVQARLAHAGAIDPNTFILGHPASPRWIVVHANHEHPAVTQARLAHSSVRAIDPNTFIVQPPVSVRWLPAADAPEQVAVAVR